MILYVLQNLLFLRPWQIEVHHSDVAFGTTFCLITQIAPLKCAHEWGSRFRDVHLLRKRGLGIDDNKVVWVAVIHDALRDLIFLRRWQIEVRHKDVESGSTF